MFLWHSKGIETNLIDLSHMSTVDAIRPSTSASLAYCRACAMTVWYGSRERITTSRLYLHVLTRRRAMSHCKPYLYHFQTNRRSKLQHQQTSSEAPPRLPCTSRTNTERASSSADRTLEARFPIANEGPRPRKFHVSSYQNSYEKVSCVEPSFCFFENAR